MNVFVLDYDPNWCAKYHCDKHVNKMILEHTQMLSHAAWKSGFQNCGYGQLKSHANHPCIKWISSNWFAYAWVWKLTQALHNEWRWRYNHGLLDIHGAYCVFQTLPNPHDFVTKDLSPDLLTFVQCMPEKYKHTNTVVAYRQYYLGEKKRFAKWKKGDVPFWWHDIDSGPCQIMNTDVALAGIPSKVCLV